MVPASEFAHLMQQLRAGAPDAAAQLLDRYGSHVIRVVRRKLSRELRSKFDSVDFTQAVWGSVFVHLDSICCIDSPEELLAFLTRVATNKVIDETRRRLVAQKFNVRREQRLDEGDASVASALASEPTPSEEVIARESWNQMLAGCSDRDRDILQMKREGSTILEIAVALDVNERTVRRVVQRVLEKVGT